MVSFLSVSLYGLAAVAGLAGALPGLPKRMHELALTVKQRRAGSTSDSNVAGYETQTQVVTRTIYKSTSGSVSPTSSGASYYTSTVTINGMQYTMCYWSKLAQHYLSSEYQLLFGSWQPIKDHSDFYKRGHRYHHGAFFSLYYSLRLYFWPSFDTYSHRKHDDRNLARSRLYLEELYAVVEPHQLPFKLVKPAQRNLENRDYHHDDTYAKQLRICSAVIFSEEFHWQFIVGCFNSICFSKHAYGNEDSTASSSNPVASSPQKSSTGSSSSAASTPSVSPSTRTVTKTLPPSTSAASSVSQSTQSSGNPVSSNTARTSSSTQATSASTSRSSTPASSSSSSTAKVSSTSSTPAPSSSPKSTQSSAQGSTSSVLSTSKGPSLPSSSTATSRSSSRTTVTVTSSSSPSLLSSLSASSSSTPRPSPSSTSSGSTTSRSRTTVTVTASGTSSQASSGSQPSGSTSTRSRTTVTVTASGTSSKVSTGSQPSVSTSSRSQTTVTVSESITSSKSPSTSPSTGLTSSLPKTSVTMTGAGSSSKASSASQPAATSSTRASSSAGQPSSSIVSQPPSSSKTTSVMSTSIPTSKVSTSSQSAAPTATSSKASSNAAASTSTAPTSSVSAAPTIVPDTSTNKPSSTSQAPASSSSAAGMTCTAGDMTYTNGQQYTDSSNVTYTVRCNSDNSQGSYSVVGVSSGGFATCFTACDESTGCAGFTYSGDANSGNCYLKSAEGTYIPAGGNLVSAFRVGGPASGGSPSSSGGPASSGSPASSSMSPVSTPNGGSCSALAAQNGTYTDENGRTYQVKCGHDYPGPNLATAGVSSYSKCFAACDAVEGCVSFSYLGGSGGGTCTYAPVVVQRYLYTDLSQATSRPLPRVFHLVELTVPN
ncbi:hypothetical protein D0864_07644 [Hortaea werneckii]|uniref:Apple domain-containing protein n=1 Tax=Hortaea werneckii TaxID=91943 RepID=A0A3M7F5S1_HORWE|nr:hypothetical protein D0864_07644 [Hortaea werneckii]